MAESIKEIEKIRSICISFPDREASIKMLAGLNDKLSHITKDIYKIMCELKFKVNADGIEYSIEMVCDKIKEILVELGHED